VQITPEKNLKKTDIQRYFRQYDLDDCLGVSLTLKQFALGVKLDEIRASKNLRHFLNLLNTKVFGKRFKRFGKRLNVIPSIRSCRPSRFNDSMRCTTVGERTVSAKVT